MRIHHALSVVSMLTLTFLASTACKDDPVGSCERIVEACHELDTGSGLAHDCHELAEAADATDAKCSEKEDECLAGCVE